MQQHQHRFGIILRLVDQNVAHAAVRQGKAQRGGEQRHEDGVLPPDDAGIAVFGKGRAQFFRRVFQQIGHDGLRRGQRDAADVRAQGLQVLRHGHIDHEVQLFAAVFLGVDGLIAAL